MASNGGNRMRKYALVSLNVLFLLSNVSPQLASSDSIPGKSQEGTEAEAGLFLEELENSYSSACNSRQIASWNFQTNITDHTKEASMKAEDELLQFQAQIQQGIRENFPNWREFNDGPIKRELKFLSIRGPATMPADNVAAMTKLIGEMESDYATATVCGYENLYNCTFRLDPEIENILSTANNHSELSHYWTSWHNKMSEMVPPSKYHHFIQYQTEMANANGFKDMSEMSLVIYDDGTPDWTVGKFKKQMLEIWKDIQPMYKTLHAYVRMKLRRMPEYEGLIDKCGYIPAYLTGNMWAQNWNKLYEITKPFPRAMSLDPTEAMIKKNYTVLKMFQEADKFFTDLGLLPMTEKFWKHSMLERPNDGRKVVCHASAFDFCLGKNNTDFRIKQCSKVNAEQFRTIHHEMGHIEYFQQYAEHHFVFRSGANPAFHEAIGDALALAVITPKHLQCTLGLDLNFDPSLCDDKQPYNEVEITSESDINNLYLTALQKLVFFPFAISMESWRWEAYEGKLTPDQYNNRWWELRQKNQGISPANNRSSPNLLDAAAKYHIVSNVEYIRYFISHILEFQFYESMCIAAGQFDPNNSKSSPHLHQCDFAGSKEAGKLLGDMMKLGFSNGWPSALEAITGNRAMSISPLKNYLQPLLDYMANELDANGEVPGFGDSCEELLT